MNKFKVEEGTVQETLMMPLYGRVYCQDHFPNTLPNKPSKEAADRVDYDFKKVESSELNMITWGLRARMLQESAKDYLFKKPNATIINLGCGLDLSFDEVDNGTCKFINFDLPDVIEAREKIVSCKEREFNYAGDLMDFKWMDEIQQEPYNVHIDEGVFIISGGVLMYFTREEMERFFKAISKAFPGGGICFDGENQKGVDKSNKIVKDTGNGTLIQFPVEDAQAMFKAWGPSFTKVQERPFPKYIKKSKEIPFKWKFVLSLGMRLGMVKIIDVLFASL